MTLDRQECLRMLTNILGSLYCDDCDVVWQRAGYDKKESVFLGAHSFRTALGLTDDEYLSAIEDGRRKICVAMSPDGPRFAFRDGAQPINVVDVLSRVPETAQREYT